MTDDIVDDAIDYMESEDAQDEGRTHSVVLEEKESTQKGVSIEVKVSTVKPDEGTNMSKVSTDKPEVSTAKPKEVEVSNDTHDKDGRQIKEMNEKSKDPKKKRVVNETLRGDDTTKVPAEQEVTESLQRKRKSVLVKRSIGKIVNYGRQNLCSKFAQGISFQRMLDLGLEVEEESTAALQLVNSLNGIQNTNWNWRWPIRDGPKAQQLSELLLQLSELNLSNTPDTWNYTLDPSLLFSVASFRRHVESSCLSPSLDPIRWNKHLPIKVNIYAWRLCLDRLPTRVNLDKKGIDLDSVRCPVCDDDMETTKHLFIECPMAVELWNLVSTWWDVGDYPRDIQGLSSWADLVNLNNFSKGYFDVVIPTTFWVLWRFRNRVCFDAKPPRKDTLGVEIKVLSHSWILHRHKKANPTWFEWIYNPNHACTNMRTKRNTKILQNFEDSIHSINNSKTNKKNTSRKSTDYQKNTKEFENDTGKEKVCNGSGEAHIDACMVTNKVREKEDGLIKNGMKENVGLFGTKNSKVNANPEKSKCTFMNKCDNDENAMLNEKTECVTNSGKKENRFNGENGVTSKSNNMTYAHIVKQDELSKNLNYIPTMITETGSEGKFRITDIDANKNGHYVFKFRDSNSLNVVLDKGPWMVKNKPMFVQKWNSEIGMEKMEPKRLSVWVKIVNVPLEAWSVDGISALASSLGKPMLMDTMTATMCHKGVGNFKYARVLMEMDAEKEFKKEIVIQYRDKDNNIKGSKTVKVVYDWKPPACTHCRVFGHDIRHCKKGGIGAVGKEDSISSEKAYKSMEDQGSGRQERNTHKVLQGYMKNSSNGNVNFPGVRTNTYNQWHNNGDGRRKIAEVWRQEYRRRQVDAENLNKKKDNNDVKNNKWNVKEKDVEYLRKTTNKYSVLDSPPEDNDQELRIIMVGWDNDTNVQVLHKTSQAIFCIISAPSIAGDMNVTLHPNENSCRTSFMSTDMMEFQDCLNSIEVEDICSSGIHFTWTKNLHKAKMGIKTGILKNVDRVMSNEYFIKQFSQAHAKIVIGADICRAIKKFFASGKMLGELNATFISLIPKVQTPNKISHHILGLTDSLEAKHIAEDASSKKFLVSNFTNYNMTDSRPVLEQYNELLGIHRRFTQHKMNMDEAIQVYCIIDKIPPSWKDFKHTLKHLKEELTFVELGSHLRTEESLKVHDSDKPKGNNVDGPSVVNMVEHDNSFRCNDNKGKRKHHDNTRADPNKKAKPTCWKCRKTCHIKRD
ncbi:zinc finger, CCHC-type containing protein [Tanacetum coccineum]